MSSTQIKQLLRQQSLLKIKPYHAPHWAQSIKLIPTSRIPLALRPTPIERWFLPGIDPSSFEISIKRDDLTGSTLSGNKVRKLEFLFADALQSGYDSVITCGGIQSNHCRTTAIAAAQLGLSCHLLLRSETLDITQIAITGNLALDRIVGAQIHLTPKAPYETGLKPKMIGIIDALRRGHQQKCYLIPVGGSTALGAWGYIEAYNEMLDQGIADKFDDIVVTCGSGGTACGIAIANYLCGSPLKIHAIGVCDDANYFYGHIDEMLVELGITDTKARDIIRVIDGYKGRGYALSSPTETEFISATAAVTGIILDPVYTGKAVLGLQTELLQRPQEFKGNRLLFIHTGGIFGAMA